MKGEVGLGFYCNNTVYSSQIFYSCQIVLAALAGFIFTGLETGYFEKRHHESSN